MRYVLGLDIGITSVGWAVLNLDKHRIEALGVRAFNAAEDPKTRASLAEPRRLARSARRRIRRRAGRLRRIKELFVEYGLLSRDQLDSAFQTSNGKPDPWELRAQGLDRLLEAEEFARALFHIAKRRGFKSNRKVTRTDTREESIILNAIRDMRARLEHYRTVGEMFARGPQFAARKRNREQDYSFTVAREMLEDEITKLFEAQRDRGNTYATPEFEQRFMELFRWQLPFASGEAILQKIGPCTFEGRNGEKRAPKNSWTAERFTLLQKLNNIEIIHDGIRRSLSETERQAIINLAYSREKVEYSRIRKELNLPEEARFAGTGLQYRKRRGEEDLSCEKSTFVSLKGYHSLRKVLEPAGLWEEVKDNHDLLDDLAFALTVYKTEDDIRQYLEQRGVREEIINVLAAPDAPSFSGVIHLSIKAARNILPYLEQGLKYHEACERAGYNHYAPGPESQRHGKLPPIDRQQITSPVAYRALCQARKVVNHIVDRYGPPTYVNIELAREIKKSAEERRKIENQIRENTKAREEEDREFRKQCRKEPTGEFKAKWRLYREQNGQCAYTQTPFDLDRLFEPGYAEIDHILPYSRSFDDRFSNKVLVLGAENRNKGDRTPYEYFGGDNDRWTRFEEWVRANIRDREKRTNLLMQDFANRQDEWIQRNLTDTQYVARYFAEFVRRHLEFADPEIRQPVRCLSGGITAIARRLWGIKKIREEDDLHHACDAAVIAALTPARIQLITQYSQAKETGRLTEIIDQETGEVYEVLRDKPFEFPPPWKHFRRELQARLSDDPASKIAELNLETYREDPPDLSPVIVSRMPIRKASGALHKDTIKSVREVDGKRVGVVRRKLTELTKDDLDKLYDPVANRRLYEEIKKRMEDHNFDAKKAFAEPLYKPSKPGKKAPIVRSVKICESQPSGMRVRGGIAENDTMIRCDVFTKDSKYYLVPVYASHIAKGDLPNKAIVAHKPEDEWIEMDSAYEFLFSLYPYDLVRVVERSGEKFKGYYRGTDRSSGRICLTPPNSNDLNQLRRFGARTLRLMEKYHVGVLGDISLVKREKRLGVANDSNFESGSSEDR